MHRIFTLIVCSLAAALACSSQEMMRYELDVDDFNELRVIEGINVDYRAMPDSAGKAVFTTTAELASVLMLDNNKKGRLDIQLSTDGINYTNLPTITVYSTFLTRVENSGDSLVRVLDVAPCPTFKAGVIGNGRIVVRNIRATVVEAGLTTGNGQLVLYGTCQSAKYRLMGTGSIQADDLKAKEVRCRITGTGTIGCYASEALMITGMGSGKVYYAGSPANIKSRAVGSIKAIPLEQGVD